MDLTKIHSSNINSETQLQLKNIKTENKEIENLVIENQFECQAPVARQRYGGLRITRRYFQISSISSARTANILRHFDDTANWGYGTYVLTITSTYYGMSTFGHNRYLARYGYTSGAASVDASYTSGYQGASPSWSAQVGIGGTNSAYRDLQLTIPAYIQGYITIETANGEILDINEGGNLYSNVYYWHAGTVI